MKLRAATLPPRTRAARASVISAKIPLCEPLEAPVPTEHLPDIYDTDSPVKGFTAGCVQVLTEKMGLEL